MKTIIAMTFVGAVLLGGLTGCSSKREVPALVGLDLKTATARLQESGLKPGQVDKEFTGNKNSGTVLRQTPGPSGMVPAGTAVHLTVEESITVPNLIGMDLDSATRTLANQDLRVQRVERKFVGDATPGAVVLQEPLAGVQVAARSPVNLVLDDFVVVPDFTGENYEAVRKMVLQSGLTLGKKLFRKSADRTEGTILNQEPEAGTKVRRDSAVQFELASAPENTSTGTRTGSNGPAKTTGDDIVDSVGDAVGGAVSNVVKKRLGGLIDNFTGGKKKSKDKNPPQPQDPESKSQPNPGTVTDKDAATTNRLSLFKK